MPDNDSHSHAARLWTVVILLAGTVLSLATYVVQSQLNEINARLDRITAFLLDHERGAGP